MRRKLWNTLIVLAIAITPLHGAQSQDTTQTDGWLSALSIGFPRVGEQMWAVLFTVGGNFTKIRPGRVGPDFAVGTMPVLLTQEVVPLGVRGGLAMALQPTRDMFIMPSAGISMIGIFSPDRGWTSWGPNAGIALVSRTGLRVGLTFHGFDDERFMLLELGAGRIR